MKEGKGYLKTNNDNIRIGLSFKLKNLLREVHFAIREISIHIPAQAEDI